MVKKQRLTPENIIIIDEIMVELIRAIEKDHPEFSESNPEVRRVRANPKEQPVPVADIVGTRLDNADKYYENWSPTPKGRDRRWWNVFEVAMDLRVIAPDPVAPICLLRIRKADRKAPECYVDVDGNRRVSVAHIVKDVREVPAVVTDLVLEEKGDLAKIRRV